MARRNTPLNNPDIKGHHCTIGERLENLGKVPFFKNLTEDELQGINKKFSATHYAQGETIYFQDEKAYLLRVVVHGHVKLVRQTMEGKDILLDMLKPGEFFGTLSTSGDAVYSETAEAQTNICVISISLKEFRSVLEEYPTVAISVLDITADRLTFSQEKVRRLTTLSVEKRIAHILLSLSNKFGEGSDQGLLIQLPLPRKDLADMTGTSEETASRIMSGFQKDGIIKTGRQWVAISDRDRLVELSNG